MENVNYNNVTFYSNNPSDEGKTFNMKLIGFITDGSNIRIVTKEVKF